jgi:hypothetical protein
MIKKIVTVAIAFGMLSVNANAQRYSDSDIPKSNVKLNLYSLIQKTVSLQYEYILGAKTSVALGLRFQPNKNIPGALLSDPSSTVTAGEFTSAKYGGYAITPEFRYYLSKQAGKGFYLAPFARYEAFTMKSNVYLKDGDPLSITGFNGKLGGMGFGLLAGAQFSLSDRISIDWWIAGPYIKAHKLSLSATSADFGLTQTDLDDFNNSFSTVDNVILSGFTGTATNQKIEISAKSQFPGIRTGLCVGFRF